MKTTVSSVYTDALAAIDTMWTVLNTVGVSNLTPAIIAFEDSMNGLSGAILGLEISLQQEIQWRNASIVGECGLRGYEVRLFSGVLPSNNVSRGTSRQVTVTGKKLYPLTTTAQMNVASATIAPVATATVNPVVDFATIATLTDDVPEEVDEVFAENDAEDVSVEPLSSLQNETTPYISNSLVRLAQTAAANANGLQDGLSTFSTNPLAGLIGTTKDLFLYYTEGNYANLNTALSVIYADGALATQYKELRESIGGADGLAGCVSQMDFLLEHTNRLSGLVLDTGSPNDVTDNDSTDEFLYVNDISGGPSVIFSFDSRYFRSATYTIQATAAALDRGHQVTTLTILHDNHHAYTREASSVYSQDPFVTYTSRLLNNRVEVLANTTAANTDFVIHGVRLRIARASKTYGEMSQTRIIEQHELLQAYLDDGIDYVALQSGSLLRGDLTAELGRLFSDMLVTFSNAGFLGLSTAEKQAGLLAMSDNIKAHRAAIQNQIDADYEQFVNCRKLTEALDIAYNLSVAYTDSTGNAIPALTLNSVTKSAIDEEES